MYVCMYVYMCVCVCVCVSVSVYEGPLSYLIEKEPAIIKFFLMTSTFRCNHSV